MRIHIIIGLACYIIGIILLLAALPGCSPLAIPEEPFHAPQTS